MKTEIITPTTKLTPEQALKMALQEDLNDVIIMGTTKEGDTYHCQSGLRNNETLWILEVAKLKLLGVDI